MMLVNVLQKLLLGPLIYKASSSFVLVSTSIDPQL